eukprot:363422-Chlamydomonas_euryale.AAC.2
MKEASAVEQDARAGCHCAALASQLQAIECGVCGVWGSKERTSHASCRPWSVWRGKEWTSHASCRPWSVESGEARSGHRTPAAGHGVWGVERQGVDMARQLQAMELGCEEARSGHRTPAAGYGVRVWRGKEWTSHASCRPWSVGCGGKESKGRGSTVCS